VSGRRRRAVSPADRRGAAIAGFAVMLISVLSAVAYLFYSTPGKSAATRSRGGADAESSPMSAQTGSERDFVPDACATLSAVIAARLAPGADRSEMSQTDESGRHSDCAWSLYGAPHSRQLTVELRAIDAADGMSATEAAVRTLQSEWRSDSAGSGLPAATKVEESRGVSGVGEQAYAVYTVDDGIGGAIANARLANVLVTVHYSGGDDRDATGRPLPSATAMDGAVSAARDVVSKLVSHP
jgi:hypothetical protein